MKKGSLKNDFTAITNTHTHTHAYNRSEKIY